MAAWQSSRDRREGGQWSAQQALKNHFLYAGATLALLAITPFAWLPRSWLPWLGSWLGGALYVLGLGRRATLENLARIFPAESRRSRCALARRVYAELGSYLGSSVMLLARPERFVAIPFEPGSRECLERALATGRGVVFASAHLGPWESVAGSLVHHGFPLTTVARETYDARFMRIYGRLRGGLGVRVIYRGTSGSATRLLRTLRKGGLLGMPMDLSSRVTSIRSTFLGAPARTAVGPARIALRTRAVVVVGTATRRAVGAGLAMRVTVVPSLDLDADASGEGELTRRLDEEISARIREFPEGWVWMHPRFENTASPGGQTR